VLKETDDKNLRCGKNNKLDVISFFNYK